MAPGIATLAAVVTSLFLLACGERSDSKSQSSGPWEKHASAPETFIGHAAATSGHQIFVAGNPQGSDRVRVLDPAADEWNDGPSLPRPLFLLAMSTVDDDIYAVGGAEGWDANYVATAFVLRAGATSWESIESLPKPMIGCAASVLGKVYFVSQTATLEFDPAVGHWASKAPIPGPLGACAPSGAALIVTGGQQNTESTASTLIYDPKLDTWSSAPQMPTSRNRHGAATLGENVYAIGGVAAYTGPPLDSVDVFDTILQQWDSGPALPSPRKEAAAVALDGRVYVIGGVEGKDPTTAVYSYSPDAQ